MEPEYHVIGVRVARGETTIHEFTGVRLAVIGFTTGLSNLYPLADVIDVLLVYGPTFLPLAHGERAPGGPFWWKLTELGKQLAYV